MSCGVVDSVDFRSADCCCCCCELESFGSVGWVSIVRRARNGSSELNAWAIRLLGVVSGMVFLINEAQSPPTANNSLTQLLVVVVFVVDVPLGGAVVPSLIVEWSLLSLKVIQLIKYYFRVWLKGSSYAFTQEVQSPSSPSIFFFFFLKLLFLFANFRN